MELSTLIDILYIVGVALLLAYISVQGRKILRFLYLTTKVPGLSIREYIDVYINGLLSDNMLEEAYKKCQERNHKPYGIWVGPVFSVSLSDCESMSQVLKSKTINDKPDVLHKVGREYLGNGLLTLNGPGYRKHRKILSPTFRPSILESQLARINEQTGKLMARLRAEASDEPLDVRSLVSRHADAMALLIFAEGRCDLEALDKWVKVLHLAGVQVQMRITNPIYYWFVHKLKKSTWETERKIKAGLSAAKSALREARATRTQSDPDRPTCLLDAMAVGDGQDHLSDEEFLDEGITLLAGAAETTGFAMNVSLLLLALHQDVQQRLYDEVQAVLGKRPRAVRADDLPEMPYLDMFVKETLRLFPPIPFVTRQLHHDTKIGDLLLPAGCALGLNVHALHRNAAVFEEPSCFDPERFSPERAQSRHRFAFLPFSYGIRNCPGQMHGMTMLKIFLSHVVRNFSISPGNGLTSVRDIKVKMYFTCYLNESSLRFVSRTD